ncbi:hypothetical protein PPTG_21838 [Phytophthora nicotianae INRA-310]|uniref:Uncharacterized protein n=1 Tax=Phytophthora nicotianae (strain INRA-310) TaxID=761204 RepID=W2QRU5_PHYN3|nr:hypothetical protein PPTG_21838 [Phytophthora nicotianae INRA-310]ETN15917.1 hypothetical protein PPTG_21838 [Phytophthora nicotianae INRA-310]
MRNRRLAPDNVVSKGSLFISGMGRVLSMTPVMIETIMFLKTNRLFWNSKLDASATREAHTDERG